MRHNLFKDLKIIKTRKSLKRNYLESYNLNSSHTKVQLIFRKMNQIQIAYAFISLLVVLVSSGKLRIHQLIRRNIIILIVYY